MISKRTGTSLSQSLAYFLRIGDVYFLLLLYLVTHSGVAAANGVFSVTSAGLPSAPHP